MKPLREGVEAPDFEGPTQEAERFRLRDHKGRWIVLYFYPMDRTIGCTKEACGFRDVHERIKALGAIVVGVSRDDALSHRDFSNKHRLPFALVADIDGQIARSYGVRAWLGRAKRTTFLIDPQGRITRVFRRLPAQSHPDAIVQELSLKVQKRTPKTQPEHPSAAMSTHPSQH